MTNLTPLNRRQFLTALAGTVAAASIVSGADAQPRPNILWITSEDNGPQLGCYGDPYANTPNLDALAARGMMYTRAWSNAPVCAPARTCIITGTYAPSIGGENMRSGVPLPEQIHLYPYYLRQAGYYCTNNSKTDYNLTKETGVWDESSGKAHYNNRKPGQPFFAIFNLTVTHESGLRRKGPLIHDPAKARVPAYHPDIPAVRQDWARYYDNMTTMDNQAGKILAELQEAGLADDTIVIYYGDHGSGMPRSKRTPLNSGLHVPVIVHFPEKFKHLAPAEYAAGAKSSRLISFVDLAPTVLSLIGIQPPQWMQGSAFLGQHQGPPRAFNFGFRGRMDERYDLVRSATDGRYSYVRNYMPHRPHGQHVIYQFDTASTAQWKKLFDEGKLNAVQSAFWQPRAPEELYDLQTDPDETKNLANSPEHQAILQKLRTAQRELALQVRDVGFLPEGEIHTRSAGSTPYEMGRDDAKYPLRKILDMADLASSLKPEAMPQLKAGLADPDSAVRYWAAMGILIRGKDGLVAAKPEMDKALADQSLYVRAIAAESLGRYGAEADLKAALAVLLEVCDCHKSGTFPAAFALNCLDNLGRDKIASIQEAIAKLPRTEAKPPGRAGGYVARLLQTINAE